MKKQRTGRYSIHNVRVTPEFREEPDIEKLARALIAIAKNLAEKKMAESADANAGNTPNSENTKKA